MEVTRDSDDIPSDNLLSQALPVSNLSKDVDLNIPPSTGEDYLSRVRLEASKVPVVVVARDIDLKKFERFRTPQFFQSDFIEETRALFKPSVEWQSEKSMEFNELRDRCIKEKENFIKSNKEQMKRIKFPKLSNKNEWFKFFFGNETDKESEKKSEGNKPLLSILYAMDQTTIVELFDMHVEWTEELGYTHESFEWMYSLMCFIAKPLLPETHSSLRTLARTCRLLRSKLNDPQDESLTPINLFIAIISRYFQQNDLADRE